MNANRTEGDDIGQIDVGLPEELLEEIDQYRATRGYPTRSAVVAQALEE